MLIGLMVTFMKRRMRNLEYVHFQVCYISSHNHWIILIIICICIESLRIRMAMEPFNEQAASTYKLKPNDDWLRRRQGLALPALPPTTPEACQYFFSKIHDYARLSSSTGRKSIDYGKF